MSDESKALRVFISYSQKDLVLRKRLVNHLAELERQGQIYLWNDEKIVPGVKWDDKIVEELNSSHIVLLLITPDFLYSDYINRKELKIAFELHKVKKIYVIPIILRPCDWKENKALAEFQVLPTNGQPVESNYWHNHDEAYTSIVLGLKKVISEVKQKGIPGENISAKGITSKPTQIQVPGGILKPLVINYIERSADTQLTGLLESSYAPMFLIIGGIQCGKTSLLYRFIKEAKCIEGNIVIHIDFVVLINSNKSPDIKDAFIYMIEKTIVDLSGKKPNSSQLQNECDTQIPSDWALHKLICTLKKYHANIENFFLIIDSIDLLHTKLTNPDKTEPLINWLARLRSEQGISPLDRLTVIASITILSYSSVKYSQLRTQAANVILPNFGKNEIEKLLKLFDLTLNIEENTQKIFNLFGAHPHLSHLAVYDLYSGINLSVIQQKSRNLMGGYGSYWRRIKRMLEFVLNEKGNRYSMNFILNALIVNEKSSNQYKAINRLFEELYILGLLEIDHKISSNFIRNAIMKEIQQNETV